MKTMALHLFIGILLTGAQFVQAQQFMKANDSIQFGEPIRAQSTASSLKPTPPSTAQPPRDLAANSEIILISGYEPSEKNGVISQVHINRPGSKVLLVLSSYEKVSWQVSASPGTTISGIIVSGHYPPTLTTSVQTRVYLSKLPYAYKTDNANFARLLEQLNTLFGVNRIDAFQGSYRIPGKIQIASLSQNRPDLTLTGGAPQKSSANFTFKLLATDCSSAPWSLRGPQGKATKALSHGKFACTQSGQSIFRLSGNDLLVTNSKTGQSSTAQLPDNFPRFSWPMDIAHDSRRNLITVVTLGGEGFLYRYDVNKRAWIDYRSLKNIDIYSLTYDRTTDRYVAWTDRGELLFISGDGSALFSKKVLPLLEGFGRLYDSGNSQVPRVQLAAQGDDIAVIYLGREGKQRVWHYNVRTNTAMFTYMRN